MKKKIFYVIFVFLFVLTGCGKKEEMPKTNVNSNIDQNNIIDEHVELKEPKVNWWKVSNFNRGINTLIIEVENTNNIDIDFEMNVTYYLNNEEVGVSESLYYNCLKANEKGIIYYNFGIPESDSIKVEYTRIGESYYKPVDFKVNENKKINEEQVYVDLDIKEDFSNGNIMIIAYKGDEIVSPTYYDFTEGLEAKSNIDVLQTFDHYDTYYNIYK